MELKWMQPLGKVECPYAYRTIFIIFGYSIRIHWWIRSDDKRHMHNHPWWFRTFVLYGSYIDVSLQDGKIVRDKLSLFSTRFRKPEHLHYVEIPKKGCLTVLITGRMAHQWRFWVNGKFLRVNRYFKRYGHPPCEEQ